MTQLPATLAALAATPALQSLSTALAGSSAELYLVGGALRDGLQGKTNKDFDLLLRHPTQDAEELETLLREQLAPAPVLAVGESFRVFKVKWAGEWLDLALPTKHTPEGWHSDPRLPLADDLGRRDFTVNALALPLGTTQEPRLIDPFGGQTDLLARRLRATLSAGERLSEDPLRILRAARFAAQGLVPDEALCTAAKALAPQLAAVAPERVWNEWLRLFEAPHSHLGLRWLAQIGALAVIIPAWAEVDGVEQHNPHHRETISDHLLSVVAELDRMNAAPLTRQAGLFHDIGKGRTRTLEIGVDGQLHGHFYGHEQVGADLTRDSLRRLRADHERTRDLTRLVELHMRPGQAATRPAARRLAAAAGHLLEPLLDLYAADRLAHVGADPTQIAERQNAIRTACNDLPRAFSEHALALGGRELLSLGLSPQQVGAAKRWLTAQVIETRVPNEREALLQLLEAEYLHTEPTN